MKKIPLILLLIISYKLQAAEIKCIGKSIIEIFVPGLGYLVNESYVEAGVWGVLKWNALSELNAAQNRYNNETDGKNVKEIKKTEYKEGKLKINRSEYTRDQYIYENYAFVYSAITYINIWDLIKHNCKTKYDSFKILLAPVAIQKWYNNPYVWGPPIGLFVYGQATKSEDEIVYEYAFKNVSKQEYETAQTLKYYMVGIVEELIFRDLIQSNLYSVFNDGFGWSKQVSWHTGVITSSVIFGSLHNGKNGSATPIIAFFGGLYFGYLYQPSPDQFNIESSIAAHSWWDIASWVSFRKRYKPLSLTANELPTLPIYTVSLTF